MAQVKIAKELNLYLIPEIKNTVQEYSSLKFVYLIRRIILKRTFINTLIGLISKSLLGTFTNLQQEDGKIRKRLLTDLTPRVVASTMRSILSQSRSGCAIFLCSYPFSILLIECFIFMKGEDGDNCDVEATIGVINNKCIIKFVKYVLNWKY